MRLSTIVPNNYLLLLILSNPPEHANFECNDHRYTRSLIMDISFSNAQDLRLHRTENESVVNPAQFSV